MSDLEAQRYARNGLELCEIWETKADVLERIGKYAEAEQLRDCAEGYRNRIHELVPDASETRRRADPKPREGFVYLMRANEAFGRLKIGFSANPESRLASLQAMSPVKLDLVRTWRARETAEGRLQEELEHYRLHGEWFLAPAAQEAVKLMEQWGYR